VSVEHFTSRDMLDTTLCLPLTEVSILLGMKKRGFGAGRWNGIGGKPKEGESIEAAAVRELEEEIGLKISMGDLKKYAVLDFFFEHKPDWNQRVHIFFVKRWVGEPTESEEMRPQWFKFSEIPFDAMWPDDRLWLPEVLQGKLIAGKFYFSDDGKTIARYEIREDNLRFF